MESMREKALNALKKIFEDDFLEVLKNEVLPSIIPESGLIILRDGDVGSPEEILSPPMFIYNHRAELEVFIQDPDPADRDEKMDLLLGSIEQVLIENPTLDGTVDYAAIDDFNIDSERIEGAPGVKAASVRILLRYTTTRKL
jgi:hypothetical protein